MKLIFLLHWHIRFTFFFIQVYFLLIVSMHLKFWQVGFLTFASEQSKKKYFTVFKKSFPILTCAYFLVHFVWIRFLLNSEIEMVVMLVFCGQGILKCNVTILMQQNFLHACPCCCAVPHLRVTPCVTQNLVFWIPEMWSPIMNMRQYPG